MTRQSSVPNLGALTMLAMSLASGFAQAANRLPQHPEPAPRLAGPCHNHPLRRRR